MTTLAGVIDPGYRGEIKVVMTNLSAVPVEIKAGDRIAQLRIVRRIEAEFDEVSELVEARGARRDLGVRGAESCLRTSCRGKRTDNSDSEIQGSFAPLRMTTETNK